jgi:hypothetical protein
MYVKSQLAEEDIMMRPEFVRLAKTLRCKQEDIMMRPEFVRLAKTLRCKHLKTTLMRYFIFRSCCTSPAQLVFTPYYLPWQFTPYSWQLTINVRNVRV